VPRGVEWRASLEADPDLQSLNVSEADVWARVVDWRASLEAELGFASVSGADVWTWTCHICKCVPWYVHVLHGTDAWADVHDIAVEMYENVLGDVEALAQVSCLLSREAACA
jgi:hypothetical protein